MSTVTLGQELAAPLAVAISASFMSLYLGELVGQARKKYKVPYPTLYAVSKYDSNKPQENKPDDAHMFNCVQRGHQNYLENLPSLLALLLIGSLSGNANVTYANAGALFLYVISRASYASGYATGDPSKRGAGRYGMFGQIASLGISLYVVAKIALPQYISF